MRSILRLAFLPLFIITINANLSYAQLLYEGMVFDGMGKPLLENASSVSVSPDGKFVYASSYNDNAVTVYSRDVSGSMGALTFVETQKNEVGGVLGLNGAFHLKISPDGNHLYVAGSLDNAITVFKRNAVNGTLTYLTTYWNNVDGVEGIAGAYFIDLPPDGNNVYVAGPDENAVAVFKRNVITGTLTFVEMIQDESGNVTQMNYPLAVMSSPDGKHVYVSSFGDNAVNVFSRNPLTGKLTFVEYHKEGESGVSGLMAAYAPYVTPDGRQVYVAGLDADAVVAFNRNPGSGELTYIDTYTDNTNGIDGVSGPTNVRVSKNGDYLFVAGSNEDAVAVFSRNADSGVISFLTMVQEGVNGVSGIAYPTYIDISDDDNNLYVSGFASASIAVFDLDDLSGNLTFMASETGAGLGVSGLDGSTAVTVSPDGNHVYVAGSNDDAIVVFERNTSTGMLTYLQEIEDASATDGLNGINCIAISADGNYVYSTSFWDKAVVVFERNTTTGLLTYLERYKDGISGVDGLNGANYITISPDGNNVYVTGYWEHAVAVFNRNAVNGTLSFVEVFKDGTLGVDGINRANGVTVSPDGTSVYVSGYNDNGIALFDRNLSNGTLAYAGVVKDGVDGVDGIYRINSVIVSPNGAQVYATGLNDDAVAIFNRDMVTGELNYFGQMKNGVGDVVGLDGPSRVTLSPNGEHVYVTSINDDGLVAFRRDLSTGELFFEGVELDTDLGVNGLDGASYVTVSPDGKHMYAASTIDDAVSVFSCTYILAMDEVVCQGDSVVIGSSVYHESGTYVDTFDFGACKSVITLKLTVQPALTSLEVEICNGDTYEFDGTLLNTSGTYDANFVTSHGCDSTVNLVLSVVNEFSTTYVDASICQGEAYEGGYTETGVYENVFTSSFGCDSTVVLNLEVHPVYNEIIEAEICEGDFYVLGTQNYIVSGTYVEPFTTINGCDSIITLILTVIEPEMVLNEAICDGDVYTIGTFSFTEEGTYDFVLESGAGCDSEVTLNLIVNETSTINLIEEICEGDSYSVGPSVYTETGVYTDVLHAQNGCDSTIVLDLTVHATTTELDVTICDGESYTVGSTTYTQSGTFTNILNATSGCGDSTVTLVLTVEPTSAALEAVICDGESYTLGNSTFTETGVYMETIVSGSGCDIEYTLNLTVAPAWEVNLSETLCAGGTFSVGNNTYDESGNYVDVLSSVNGCDSLVNLSLTVLAPIEATEAIQGDNGSNTGAIHLSVSGGMEPYSYEWSNGATTQDITGLSIGTYSVLITDANGCTIALTYEVDQTNSTFEIDANIDVKVFPNPAPVGGVANLSFNINKQQTLTIQLFDSIGKLVHSERVDFLSGSSVHNLKLPNIQGLYQLYIETEEGKYKTIQLSVK